MHKFCEKYFAGSEMYFDRSEIFSDGGEIYSPLLKYISLLRAVPEIILGGATFFSDPSTPRTYMGSEPPSPQDTSVL